MPDKRRGKMKYRKRVEKPQGPVSPPPHFWGGAGKAYALLIAAGLLGASPAGGPELR